MSSDNEILASLEFYNIIVIPLYSKYMEQTQKKITSLSSDYEDFVNFLAIRNDELALNKAAVIGIRIGEEFSIYLNKQIDDILSNKDLAKWCSIAPRKEVSEAKDAALFLNKEASRLNNEATNVEQRVFAAKSYKKACDSLIDFINLYDPELLHEYRSFILKNKLKDYACGGLVGALVTFIFVYLTPLLPGQQKAYASLPTPQNNIQKK